jgi:hypothetical protein
MMLTFCPVPGVVAACTDGSGEVTAAWFTATFAALMAALFAVGALLEALLGVLASLPTAPPGAAWPLGVVGRLAG